MMKPIGAGLQGPRPTGPCVLECMCGGVWECVWVGVCVRVCVSLMCIIDVMSDLCLLGRHLVEAMYSIITRLPAGGHSVPS